MKYSILFVLSFSLFLILISCSNRNNKHIVAIVDEEIVESSAINTLVEKDIYEYLYKIYEIRYAVTQEYLRVILLKKAAAENKITIDSILKAYKNNHKNNIINEELLRKQLIDSLFIHYNAQILLEEPIAPLMRIDKALIHVRGNEDSNITITELSDFDCGICSYLHKGYLSLYNQYSNRVKFVHSTFSSEVSPSARAALAAGMQDRYWEMSDTLFAMQVPADSMTVMNIAMQMELDFDQFVSDYTSEENINLLSENNAYLSSCGVEQTPTILLNGHPMRKPNDIKYISDHIDRILNETN